MSALLAPITSNTYEIYDPATKTWTDPQPLHRPRGEGNQVVRLSDGRVAITGGYTQSTFAYEPTAEVYDPATGEWTETGAGAIGRSGHVAIALSDNSVLVAGGFATGASAQRLLFPLPPKPEAPKDETVTLTPTPTPTPTATPAAKPRPAAPAKARVKRATVRAATASVTVGCTGAAGTSCTVRLRLMAGKTALATRSVTVEAGRSTTVKLTLSAKRKRALKRAKLKATLVVDAGPTTVSRQSVTFKRAR